MNVSGRQPAPDVFNQVPKTYTSWRVPFKVAEQKARGHGRRDGKILRQPAADPTQQKQPAWDATRQLMGWTTARQQIFWGPGDRGSRGLKPQAVREDSDWPHLHRHDENEAAALGHNVGAEMKENWA